MTTPGPPASPDGQPGLVALPARSPAERLRLLLRLSETLAATKDVDEVARAFTDIALQYLGATFGGVAVIDGDGLNMHYLTLLLLPDPVRLARQSFPLASDRPAAIVTRRQHALFIDSLAAARRELDDESVAAITTSAGKSVAYVPMLLGSRPVGAIVLMWAHEVSFTEDDRRVMWALAQYTAQAVERAQLLADRRAVAHTLQAALLPVLPPISWLEMAGEYRPASTADMVGGDWYDAFVSVPAGPGDDDVAETLTVCVGDVTGHDTHAAAEMGRLQAKLRALAIDAPALPHRLLERLERVMTANIHNRLATAVAANLTPRADGTIDMAWSNAGHLPPLIVAPASAPHFLEQRPQPLLGLRDRRPRTTHTVTLQPGTTVLMYTDGLVERRGQSIDEGMAELARTADVHRDLDLTQLARLIVDRAAADAHQDDTVVFALRVPDHNS
jgi:serine phosphatase RsbU (regulator of sigma subunit)